MNGTKKGKTKSSAAKRTKKPARKPGGPTPDALKAEAARLGKEFTRVTYALGDLIADGHEALGAEADAKDLQKRGYPVSSATFKRIRLLLELLTPTVVAADEARAESKTRTAKADAARVRLLEIRSQLAAIAAAGDLPADWFKLSLRKTDRINPVVQRLSEVLALARRQKKSMPDRDVVEKLITEGEALVAEHTSVRVDRSLVRGKAAAAALLTDQLTALLWEELQRLSRIGLAAYPGDASRERRYRLDHVYAQRDGDPDTDSDDNPEPADG